MPRAEFQEQLEALRADVVELSEVVLSRYERAIETMETGDSALAEEVVMGDDEINRQYLALESDCIDLFALQQPVASDLRFVASSFKILTDLERIGDLATNIAGYRGHTGADRYPMVDLLKLGAFAGDMLRDAMAAYEAADPVACRRTAARDEEFDEQCAAAAEAVVTGLLGASSEQEPTQLLGDPDGVDAIVDDATRLLLIVRDLERVGDHAVNVCARTLYATTNDTGLIY
ncbi:MAG: phosphate signaling complex protein PhoU [Haloarculaceae archaeon]